MIEHIDRCRSCGCGHIKGFFDLGAQPFANSLKRVQDQSQDRHELSLCWCPECRLVALEQTARAEELFSEYVWVTGTSGVATEYSRRFCETVLEVRGDSDGRYILEAASNDGTFLRPFAERGHRVLGVDPARNIVEKASAGGIETRCGFFGEAAAEEIAAERGKAGVVIARNVLPHAADVHDFLKGIEVCCDEETLVVIEVHYAGVILEELHYDSIYHEHLCYFTLRSVEELLQRHGLYVRDIRQSEISGGSMVLFAGRGRKGQGESVGRYRDFEERNRTNELSSWESFSRRALTHRTLLREMLEEEIGEGRRVAGYGASARSSTLLNFCGIGRRHIAAIADQNPLKQGLFTAGTSIPIASPEDVLGEGCDTVVILAWNFEEEIAGILRGRFGYEGRVIVPLPGEPRVYSMGGANVGVR